ncbi:hypothetical protein TNIN_393091 [Trichonephila inaurata madagascariensis]|uniref:Uncharacterized protein n=1 Tax=Trichonephila inaurata madagascariensis TaxID=2747483 RepID=A0A8X7CTX5_9ARAC|nr:hypothetical protein TNIN_393091 [Trichonephila inaurata madagascariensis]
MDIINLLVQVLPDHEPHDVPWFGVFSYFEPADLHSDYMGERPPKGKAPSSKPLWTEYAKPKLYGLVYKTETTWCSNLDHLDSISELKRCWTGVLGRNGPIAYFRVPDACPILLGTMHWPERRTAAMHFTYVASLHLPRREKHLPPLQSPQSIEGIEPLGSH